MSQLRNTFLIERSMLCLDKLRQNTGLSAAKIEDVVRGVYRSPKLLSFAPSPNTVASFFSGKRAIPFDPKGSVPSWLQAMEICFEGSARYFFHPLPNMLGGPLVSSEKVRRRQRSCPPGWIAEAERDGFLEFASEEKEKNERLCKRIRNEKDKTGRDLDWIHANMYVLSQEVREVLLVSPGLSGYRRRCESVEHQGRLLVEHGDFEALTGAYAMFLEANVIRDANRVVASRELVIELLPTLKKDEALKRVSTSFEASITEELRTGCFPRYDAFEMLTQTLPPSWQSHALRKWGDYKVDKLNSPPSN